MATIEDLGLQGAVSQSLHPIAAGGAVEVDELRRFLEEGVVRAAGAGGAASSGTCVTLTLGGQNVAAVRLGSGSFGEVHLGARNGQLLAVKMFSLPLMGGSASLGQQLHFMVQEAQVLGAVLRRRIFPRVVFYGLGSSSCPPVIASEFLTRGSLHTAIRSSATDLRLNRPEGIVRCCMELARSVDDLSNLNLVHKDIKTDNFLVSTRGGSISFVLGDAGLVRPVGRVADIDRSRGNVFAKTPEEWINSQLCHTSDLPGLGYVLLDLLVSVGAGTWYVTLQELELSLDAVLSDPTQVAQLFTDQAFQCGFQLGNSVHIVCYWALMLVVRVMLCWDPKLRSTPRQHQRVLHAVHEVLNADASTTEQVEEVSKQELVLQMLAALLEPEFLQAVGAGPRAVLAELYTARMEVYLAELRAGGSKTKLHSPTVEDYALPPMITIQQMQTVMASVPLPTMDEWCKEFSHAGNCHSTLSWLSRHWQVLVRYWGSAGCTPEQLIADAVAGAVAAMEGAGQRLNVDLANAPSFHDLQALLVEVLKASFGATFHSLPLPPVVEALARHAHTIYRCALPTAGMRGALGPCGSLLAGLAAVKMTLATMTAVQQRRLSIAAYGLQMAQAVAAADQAEALRSVGLVLATCRLIATQAELACQCCTIDQAAMLQHKQDVESLAVVGTEAVDNKLGVLDGQARSLINLVQLLQTARDACEAAALQNAGAKAAQQQEQQVAPSQAPAQPRQQPAVQPAQQRQPPAAAPLAPPPPNAPLAGLLAPPPLALLAPVELLVPPQQQLREERQEPEQQQQQQQPPLEATATNDEQQAEQEAGQHPGSPSTSSMPCDLAPAAPTLELPGAAQPAHEARQPEQEASTSPLPLRLVQLPGTTAGRRQQQEQAGTSKAPSPAAPQPLQQHEAGQQEQQQQQEQVAAAPPAPHQNAPPGVTQHVQPSGRPIRMHAGGAQSTRPAPAQPSQLPALFQTYDMLLPAVLPGLAPPSALSGLLPGVSGVQLTANGMVFHQQAMQHILAPFTADTPAGSSVTAAMRGIGDLALASAASSGQRMGTTSAGLRGAGSVLPFSPLGYPGFFPGNPLPALGPAAGMPGMVFSAMPVPMPPPGDFAAGQAFGSGDKRGATACTSPRKRQRLGCSAGGLQLPMSCPPLGPSASPLASLKKLLPELSEEQVASTGYTKDGQALLPYAKFNNNGTAAYLLMGLRPRSLPPLPLALLNSFIEYLVDWWRMVGHLLFLRMVDETLQAACSELGILPGKWQEYCNDHHSLLREVEISLSGAVPDSLSAGMPSIRRLALDGRRAWHLALPFYSAAEPWGNKSATCIPSSYQQQFRRDLLCFIASFDAVKDSRRQASAAESMVVTFRGNQDNPDLRGNGKWYILALT